jgi:peptidoglycan-associated lipoprotein
MLRSSILGGTVAAVCALTFSPRAEACGLKLTVQAAKVNKQVQPSANPSRILVWGEPTGRLDRALSQAGHEVEVVDDAQGVKSKPYRVVLVDDNKKVGEAQTLWPDADVMMMGRSTSGNLATVEDRLTRKPTDALTRRTAVAAAEDRRPVAAGPEGTADRGKLVAAGSGEPTLASAAPTPAAAAAPPPPAPAPAPAKREEVAKAPPPPAPAPVKEEEEEEEVAPAPIARASAPINAVATVTPPRPQPSAPVPKHNQIFFGLASSALSGSAKSALAQHARWLKANSSASLTIEGHTDTLGPSEYNLALSERRAGSAHKHLLRLGVSEDQIKVIGYGEEKPAFDPGENPKNRRVVLVRSE